MKTLKEIKNKIIKSEQKRMIITLEMIALSRIMYNDEKGNVTEETKEANKKYYRLHKLTRKMRDNELKLHKERMTIEAPQKAENLRLHKAKQEQEQHRAEREAGITSITYERARKRTSKDFNAYFNK